MPNAYFVSDIHKTSPEDKRACLFAAFLHTLAGKTNITHLLLRWFLRTWRIRLLIRSLPASLIARIGDRASAFRSANLGSWLDAPGYFKLDGNDGRFYELTEENLRQPRPHTLERLSAVK